MMTTDTVESIPKVLPVWIDRAAELRKVDPTGCPAVWVNLLFAEGYDVKNGRSVKLALQEYDQQQRIK